MSWPLSVDSTVAVAGLAAVPSVGEGDEHRRSVRPQGGDRKRDRAVAAADRLEVELTSPSPRVRGRLALFIDGAIERALEACGAPPPGLLALTIRTTETLNLAASLDDQLHRTLASGREGILLRLSTLSEIADRDGALDAEDSATLRWWLVAARERPVQLVLDESDRELLVYEAPSSIATLVARMASPVSPPVGRRPQTRPAAIFDDDTLDCAPQASSVSAVSDLANSMDGSPTTLDAECLDSAPHSSDAEYLDSAPHSSDAEHAASIELIGDEPRGAWIAEAARSMMDGLDENESAGWLRETLLRLSTPPPAVARGEQLGAVGQPAPSAAPANEPVGQPAPSAAPANEGVGQPAPSAAPANELTTSDPQLSAAPSEAVILSAPPLEAFVEADPTDEPRVAEAEPEDDSPAEPSWAERCEQWRRELEASNGPKPLAVVERQFTSAYVPLREAVDRDLAPPDAVRALELWATSFERSYSEAFNALRIRGKRPTMVLDLPEIALRVARLHGARTVQLLLVDGMRYDVGLRVNELLSSLTGQRAACAESFLLWAALPSTTATQLELIGRGPHGLRDFTGEVNEDFVVARGKKSATIRRLRTGHRELLKLDIVEARMSEPGGPAAERLDAVANEVAERVAVHLEGVPDRTLVMIFGDHGFVLEPIGQPTDGGTRAAKQGGATPEEVLVPGFAWIVGVMH